MANTAINHDPAATFPGSSTDIAVVKWSGTGGKTLANSGVTIDASNNLTVPGNITTTGYVHLTGDEKALRFYEGSNFISIAAPSGLDADYTLTLPLNDGATNEYLQTNGSGVLTWAAAGGDFSNGGDNGALILGTNDANTLTFETTNTARIVVAAAGDVTVSTGNLVIGTAGKGIDFAAQTQSTVYTASAELLDHYEEGAWTPFLADNAGVNTKSQASSVETGFYTRVGRLVTCEFSLTLSSLGTLTQSQGARIGGLPFAAANDTHAGVVFGQGEALNMSHNATFTGYMSGSVIILKQWNEVATGTSTPRVDEISADGHLNGHITYHV